MLGRLEPTSSSAMARSLDLISLPLTRATTGSVACAWAAPARSSDAKATETRSLHGAARVRSSGTSAERIRDGIDVIESDPWLLCPHWPRGGGHLRKRLRLAMKNRQPGTSRRTGLKSLSGSSRSVQELQIHKPHWNHHIARVALVEADIRRAPDWKPTCAGLNASSRSPSRSDAFEPHRPGSIDKARTPSYLSVTSPASNLCVGSALKSAVYHGARGERAGTRAATGRNIVAAPTD